MYLYELKILLILRSKAKTIYVFLASRSTGFLYVQPITMLQQLHNQFICIVIGWTYGKPMLQKAGKT